jgi:hypothetical protein
MRYCCLLGFVLFIGSITFPYRADTVYRPLLFTGVLAAVFLTVPAAGTCEADGPIPVPGAQK